MVLLVLSLISNRLHERKLGVRKPHIFVRHVRFPAEGFDLSVDAHFRRVLMMMMRERRRKRKIQITSQIPTKRMRLTKRTLYV